MTQSSSRRDFLKTSAVAGGGLAAGWAMYQNVHAQSNHDTIRVGLVGCGGRGTGAAEQNLRGDSNCRLVAVGDTFRDKAESTVNRLRGIREISDKVTVNPDHIFIGLDAYQNVIQNSDLVILATPPGFRPQMIQAVVNARKHLFTEKPVAVDGPGIRTVLAAFETANRNRTSVVAGTQRRYQTGYKESMQRLHDGAIGTITSGRCYWNQGGLWHRARTQGMTDVEWQIRNWLYFTWLSGDHIVEQHVHNLDVINWALGNSHPVRCTGTGGRQVRTGPEFGHIYDHFAIDYEYPNGVHVLSMARQQQGCDNNISEGVAGTRGRWSSDYRITGERPWSFPRRQDNQPYQEEHNALYRSIRTGQPINDLKNVAESTLTAIMGRMSAYTGKVVTWDDALNSPQNLMPANLTFQTRLPVPPVAMPGQA
jgi:predicted dehydrogenase